MEKIKELATIAGGILFFVAVVSLPVVFFMGSVWASENLMPALFSIGWILLAVNVVVLLPLSLFKRLRGFTGGGIFLSSYVFGLLTWLLGFILTYAIWGVGAVIVGILFLGGGVVPIAMLATGFNGYWEQFFIVLVLAVLTFGARVGGMLIVESGN